MGSLLPPPPSPTPQLLKLNKGKERQGQNQLGLCARGVGKRGVGAQLGMRDWTWDGDCARLGCRSRCRADRGPETRRSRSSTTICMSASGHSGSPWRVGVPTPVPLLGHPSVVFLNKERGLLTLSFPPGTCDQQGRTGVAKAHASILQVRKVRPWEIYKFGPFRSSTSGC